ncbi:MAG TPA: hypothetical protein VHV10_05070 [Ktedonobacteraceae bacterium]|jgi:hypothetical protein|nr:hypothetical protein [Ktedonobacteraceae bacterium]
MVKRHTQETAELVAGQLRKIAVGGENVFDTVLVEGSDEYWNIFVKSGLERSVISLRREEEKDEDVVYDLRTGVDYDESELEDILYNDERRHQ